MPTQDRSKSSQGSKSTSSQHTSNQSTMNQGDRSTQHATSPDRSNPSSLSGKDKDRSHDMPGSSSRSHQDRKH